MQRSSESIGTIAAALVWLQQKQFPLHALKIDRI